MTHKNAFKTLGAKQEGKRPLGNPRCTVEISIKKHLKKNGCDDKLDLSGSG
jgi:hypothetical protein